MYAIERELEILKAWFDVDKLSLNIRKTKFMVFGIKDIDGDIQLKFCDAEIERVFETKCFRVVIDHKLTWKQHIDQRKNFKVYSNPV